MFVVLPAAGWNFLSFLHRFTLSDCLSRDKAEGIGESASYTMGKNNMPKVYNSPKLASSKNINLLAFELVRPHYLGI